MNPSLTSLRTDASRAKFFFSQEEQVRKLPFVHSYPKNSCEVVSAFLGVALKYKYVTSTVEVVKAYRWASSEYHFWVQVDSFVVDATAHQFAEYKRPIVCVGPSPLAERFPDIERLQPEAALHQLGAIQLEFKQWMVTSLARELAS